ncbi:hypothetical protein V2I01_36570 [Micromonospora sp. BRA006-A]|nr:hypothetical protein [Micromonospora sp. BRA006-A]
MIEQETQPEAIPEPRNAPEGGPSGRPPRFPARCGRSAYGPSSTTCTSSSRCCPRAIPSGPRRCARSCPGWRWCSGAAAWSSGCAAATWSTRGRRSTRWAGHGGRQLRGRADRAAARVPQRGGTGAARRRQGAHRPRPVGRRPVRGAAARPGAGVAAALYSASDEFHESARRLRNRMLGLSVFALLAEVLVVLVQWLSHDVRLLEAPTDAGGVPAWRLLFFVLIAGALGAFLSALPSMITSRSGGLPYKLPFQQGLLKLAVGPLVAVVGIMLVIGGLVETSVSSTAALLGLAIVFGAGQQAVTAFADRRAAELLGPAAKS